MAASSSSSSSSSHPWKGTKYEEDEEGDLVFLKCQIKAEVNSSLLPTSLGAFSIQCGLLLRQRRGVAVWDPSSSSFLGTYRVVVGILSPSLSVMPPGDQFCPPFQNSHQNRGRGEASIQLGGLLLLLSPRVQFGDGF